MAFDILSTPVAQLWLERMSGRDQWCLDDPTRFYGFHDREREQHIAEHMINQCIDTINSYLPIIQKPFTSAKDQDMLNYLHNIFERYHGQLDQQNHDFWLQAPEQVRQALARLNIAVHRCECLDQHQPRVVCTWWGMPKTQHLDLVLQQSYGQLGADFGGVYLNYVEIGKTAHDMAHDDDQYMAPDMFRPFDHYSADFYITFFDQTPQDLEPDLDRIRLYFDQHRDFFLAHGIHTAQDVRMLPLRHKVAQLNFDHADRSAILDLVRQNQIITKVEIA